MARGSGGAFNIIIKEEIVPHSNTDADAVAKADPAGVLLPKARGSSRSGKVTASAASAANKEPTVAW